MNKIKNAFSKIKASDEFKNTLIKNLQNTPVNSRLQRKKLYYRPLITAASILIIFLGIVTFKVMIDNKENKNVKLVPPTYLVTIPKIELPNGEGGRNAKMVPLIVYNGRIYTSSFNLIDSVSAKKLLGEKLGITKPNLDEWSKQEEYSKEFASTIGEQEVYTVKGYDKAFRIMTYTVNQDGTVYSQFYECLNGLTIKTGEDLFGKLKLQGNITEAKFRSYSDWNNSVENFIPIKDIDLLGKFLTEVNKSTPYLRENIESSLGDYQNDDQYREITLNLKDGTKVTFSILKSGFVYYNSPEIYFKIDNKIFQEFWKELSIK